MSKKCCKNVLTAKVTVLSGIRHPDYGATFENPCFMLIYGSMDNQKKCRGKIPNQAMSFQKM